MDYGEVIGECLAQEKIKMLFSLSGAHILPIYEGCIKNDIQIIHFRDERAAVHAAEGFARVTKRIGVACITAGVGLTNGITGIASAYSDNIPLLILAGRHSIIDEGKGGLQELYGVDICKSITKWSWCAYDGENIPRFLKEGIWRAIIPTPGPTLLEIPFDVLMKEAEEWNSKCYGEPIHNKKVKVEGDPLEIKKAVELLITAERPLIIAGDDAYWSEAGEAIAELVNKLMIPIYGTRLGTGVVDESSPLAVHRAWRTKITKSADVILTFGVNFWHGEGYGEPPVFSNDAKVIQVDPDQKRLYHNVKPKLAICGDSKSVAQQMLSFIEKYSNLSRNSGWLKTISEIKESFEQNNKKELERFKNAKPIHPAVLGYEMNKFVKERKPITVIDGADCVSYVEKWIKASYIGQIIPINPLGVVGNGIPLGIGAKLGAPDKTVLVNIGDGGFGICGMEIETAARYEIPLLTVVANNSAWGATYSLLKFIYGKDTAPITALKEGIRYDKIAEELGGIGIYVEDPDHINKALNEGFSLLQNKKPVVLNIVINREVFGPIYTGRIAPLFYRPRPKKISISIQYPFEEEHRLLYPGSIIEDYNNLQFTPIVDTKRKSTTNDGS